MNEPDPENRDGEKPEFVNPEIRKNAAVFNCIFSQTDKYLMSKSFIHLNSVCCFAEKILQSHLRSIRSNSGFSLILERAPGVGPCCFVWWTQPWWLSRVIKHNTDANGHVIINLTLRSCVCYRSSHRLDPLTRGSQKWGAFSSNSWAFYVPLVMQVNDSRTEARAEKQPR